MQAVRVEDYEARQAAGNTVRQWYARWSVRNPTMHIVTRASLPTTDRRAAEAVALRHAGAVLMETVTA